MEPFGGTDNFDISEELVVYTTKDTEIEQPTHTRQNVCELSHTVNSP